MGQLGKQVLGIMSRFRGLDGGDFGLRRLAGYLGLISAVKIRIRGGSRVIVTQLPQGAFRLSSRAIGIKAANKGQVGQCNT
jgi:hypothetical protein